MISTKVSRQDKVFKFNRNLIYPHQQKAVPPRRVAMDMERCQKAGIPEEKRIFKTKPQLILEMIKEHLNDGVYFDYINCDGPYGNSYEFVACALTAGVYVKVNVRLLCEIAASFFAFHVALYF